MIRCQSFAVADAMLDTLANVPLDFTAKQLNVAAHDLCLDSDMLVVPWESDGLTLFGEVLRGYVSRSVQADPLVRPRLCSISKKDWNDMLKEPDSMFLLWTRVMFGDLSGKCKRFGCNASLLVYAVAFDVTFKVFNNQMNEPNVIEPSHAFRAFAKDDRFGTPREVVLVNTLDSKWMSTRRQSTNIDIDPRVAGFLDQLGSRVREQVRATSTGLHVDRYAPCWSLSAGSLQSLWVGESSLQHSVTPEQSRYTAGRMRRFLQQLGTPAAGEAVELVFHGTDSREAGLSIASSCLARHKMGKHMNKFGPGYYYSTEALYSHDYSTSWAKPRSTRSFIVVFLFLKSRDAKQRAKNGDQPPDYFRVSDRESSSVPVAYIELIG